MDENLEIIKSKVYEKCRLKISNLRMELESKEYSACRFELNGLKIINRNARMTPKKVGQFVTFWKRNVNGTIEPLEEKDPIDFFTVNVRTENRFGQFVFPKSLLIKNGIISTEKTEGKRAFRVYPVWDEVKNKQAESTQKWQLKYFFEIGDTIDIKRVSELYSSN
jgi:hypothetical protein